MNSLLAALFVAVSVFADPAPVPAPVPAPADPPAQKDNPPADAPAEQHDKKAARPQPPQSAVLALTRWHAAALCSTCKGTGKVTKTIVTDTKSGTPQKAGPTIRQPITKEVKAECDVCEGTCLTKDKRLVSAANAFAKALAQVDTADKNWPAAHDDLLVHLRELVALGKRAWQDRLNNTIGVLLTGTVLKNAVPVVFVGFLDGERQKNETNDRRLWVRVDNASVRFEQPRLVDTSTKELVSDHQIVVLCGGWLVAREDDKGHFVSVLENGFVMSVR